MKMKKPEFGKNRVCSQCQASEPEVEIYDVIIPPSVPRCLCCKKCMQVLIDSSVEKNAAKQRDR